MMRRLQRIFKKYGSSVTVTRNGSTRIIKAFVQPFHYKYKTYFDESHLSAGIFDGNHMLMIAPADTVLGSGTDTVVASDGESYFVKSSGRFRVKNKAVYVWAVLAARTGAAEDDYE